MQSLKNILYTIVLLIISTIISAIFYAITHNSTAIPIIYILYVLLVARFTSGYFYGILASLFGIIGVNYYFTYPFMELNFSISGYPLTFCGMLIVSLITSTLTTHIKEHARISSEREASLHILNEASKQLIRTEGKAEIIKLVLDFTSNLTHTSTVFYSEDPLNCLPTAGQYLVPKDELIFIEPYEREAAHLAFLTGQTMMPFAYCNQSKGLYIPITSHEQSIGVLGLYSTHNNPSCTDILSFLDLFVPQVSLAFQRQELSDSHQQLAIESEKEKMRANLLRAISHDLRTPLTSMIGASSIYLENNTQLDEAAKLQLVSQFNEDANWLLHIVENLLSITRIHQETATVKKSLEPLEEVIAESIMRVKKRIPNAQINATVPVEFLMVPMEPTLIEQVLINLLENSLKYSQSTEPIILKATKKISDTHGEYVEIQVKDFGVGIDPERLDTIFDGYSLNTTCSSDSSKGMGIGLSICKTIIAAHGGDITATNQEKGITFIFTLPLQGDEPFE